jgi:hypothetical protein
VCALQGRAPPPPYPRGFPTPGFPLKHCYTPAEVSLPEFTQPSPCRPPPPPPPRERGKGTLEVISHGIPPSPHCPSPPTPSQKKRRFGHRGQQQENYVLPSNDWGQRGSGTQSCGRPHRRRKGDFPGAWPTNDSAEHQPIPTRGGGPPGKPGDTVKSWKANLGEEGWSRGPETHRDPCAHSHSQPHTRFLATLGEPWRGAPTAAHRRPLETLSGPQSAAHWNQPLAAGGTGQGVRPRLAPGTGRTVLPGAPGPGRQAPARRPRTEWRRKGRASSPPPAHGADA